MKSQDILLALKLICIESLEYKALRDDEFRQFLNEHPETHVVEETYSHIDFDIRDSNTALELPLDENNALEFEEYQSISQDRDWEGWNDEPAPPRTDEEEKLTLKQIHSLYTVRGLASVTGISKTEVSSAIKRLLKVGLAFSDDQNSIPRIFRPHLLNFLVHGLRFVFPANVSFMTRGIPTSFSSPALKEHLDTAGDLIYVWPDPLGKQMGQAIDPIYPSVPFAVRKDRELYALLSLLDAIRLGNPRESKLARSQLEQNILEK